MIYACRSVAQAKAYGSGLVGSAHPKCGTYLSASQRVSIHVTHRTAETQDALNKAPDGTDDTECDDRDHDLSNPDSDETHVESMNTETAEQNAQRPGDPTVAPRKTIRCGERLLRAGHGRG
jgi:hypothetical protein